MPRSVIEIVSAAVVAVTALVVIGLLGCCAARAESPAPTKQEAPAEEGVVNVGQFLTAEIHGIYRHGTQGNEDTLAGGFHGETKPEVKKFFEPYLEAKKFRVLCADPAAREKLKPFDGKKVAVIAILTVGDLNTDEKIIRPHIVVAAIKELK